MKKASAAISLVIALVAWGVTQQAHAQNQPASSYPTKPASMVPAASLKSPRKPPKMT